MDLLPVELTDQILRNVDVSCLVRLCLSTQVNFHDDDIWRRAFLLAFPSIATTEASSWKMCFYHVMSCELRWRKGQYQKKKLVGHRGGVSCCDLSGSVLCSGSADCDVILWDLDSASGMATLRGHKQGITCVLMNSEKDCVISGSMDGCIIVWSLSTLQPRLTLNGHESSILCMRYRHQNDTLITGSGDHTARIWNVQTGACLHVLQGHLGNIICIESNDQIVVTGSKDAQAMVWSIETGELLSVLKGHTDDVYCMSIWDDIVVTGSLDCRLKFWRLTTGELLRTVHVHKGDVLALLTSADKLFSASVDRTIRMWPKFHADDIDENASTAFCGHTAAVELLALGGPRMGFVVSAGSDKTVRVWDTAEATCLVEITGFEWVLSMVADASRIVVTSASSGDISLICFEPIPEADPHNPPSTDKKDTPRHSKANCSVQ